MQKAYPEFNDNKVVVMSATKYITKDEDELGYDIKLFNTKEP
ncbi:crossover junction endodeoxyribonuclease RusA [Vibrio parahaemolyticus]|nr:putative crossover junction endodeoxyribonuclease RusA [Vibrio parahaemolyticus 12310]KHF15291.1 crossover junction endodeoxyribonuclease RusA [Vibrio parahaemolyticus]ODX26557.1 crossover junction endodeoxyribonuclease RusA [Vibrio parahaemolyticus]OTV96833.1 crossover junction endodeoxyribonuclease RusA [Vibrio parahaemolyticus]OTW02304.1 crossover junction endodeoxyribonuclease RusA [Vibrio parahaemolyticus]